MMALTLTQPWATLIAIGAKRIETRSWYTDYRGKLAIHSAKSFPSWARSFAMSPAVCDAMRPYMLGRGWKLTHYPLGKIVAIVDLTNVKRIVIPGTIYLPDFQCPPPGEPELHFGDYSPGRFAWFMDEICALQEPIPARGCRRLWHWYNYGSLQCPH